VLCIERRKNSAGGGEEGAPLSVRRERKRRKRTLSTLNSGKKGEKKERRVAKEGGTTLFPLQKEEKGGGAPSYTERGKKRFSEEEKVLFSQEGEKEAFGPVLKKKGR